MDRQIKVVIFAHPRSGSSSLHRLLQLHPSLNLAEEPFHDQYSKWYPGERNYIDHIHDIPSLEAQLSHFFARHNGMKILQYQLPVELSTHLLLKPELRIVFLRRRNLLQAAVSGEIAEQTAVWKVWDLKDDLAKTYRKLAPIPIKRLRDIITYYTDSMNEYADIVDQRVPGSYIKLWHEDLYTEDLAHNRQLLGRVFALLGLSLPDSPQVDRLLDPATTKLNNEASYRLVPNAEEINARLGNDRTGWLFAKR